MPRGASGRARYPIDLHMHSAFSDGELSPTALVEEAHRRGVRAISLTDHDTTDGLPEARDAGARLGVGIIAGIELSTWFDREVHVLGYFVDPRHPELDETARRQQSARVRRLRAIGERLEALGRPIDTEAIIASTPGNVGRPHIARAMVAAGYARTTDEVFRRFLGNDGPAYVPIERLSTTDAIEVIHAAGGVAVLAHPGVDKLFDAVPTLAEAGLDGLEVGHPAHARSTSDRLRTLAHRHDLVPTGGSDFHRPQSPYKLGHFGVDDAGLARLRDRRRAA